MKRNTRRLFQNYRVVLCGITGALCLSLTALAPGAVWADDAYQTSNEDLGYDEFADTILAQIIKEGMTDEEKCHAVYEYVHYIPYVNVVYSEDYRENGYRMLHDRAGDCFGFYSASRLLLERLGYDVIELQNINGFTHVWCLVSIDDGRTWRHFDPTSWSWGSDGELCLLTDEEMTAYGTKHQVGYNQLSHDWDHEKVAGEIQSLRNLHKEWVYLFNPQESGQSASIW